MARNPSAVAKVERGRKDGFASFFEDPSRETLRELLKNHVGETRFLDFKTEWPDHPALAKHCLGFANTGGGCLIFGVEEQGDKSLTPVGLHSLADKADIHNGLKNYLPSDSMSQIEVMDFSFDASEYPKIIGKKFQALFVTYQVNNTPAVALKSGNGIRKGAIYIRHEGVTEEASYDDLQRVLNRRIETEYSSAPEKDLQQHLNQLQVLYSEIPKVLVSNSFFFFFFLQIGEVFKAVTKENPSYPKEDYQTFVLRMIEAKKDKIAQELGVRYKG